MNTFIVYDENGKVILTQNGGTFPTEIFVKTVDVPNGREVSSINVETGEVVLRDIPQSETEKRLEELEAQVAALTGTEDEYDTGTENRTCKATADNGNDKRGSFGRCQSSHSSNSLSDMGCGRKCRTRGSKIL